MINLTISLDENIVRLARIRAIGEGTSVSAKVREFLAQYAKAGVLIAPSKPLDLPVFRGGGGLLQELTHRATSRCWAQPMDFWMEVHDARL